MLSFALPDEADSLEEPVLPEDVRADTEVPDPELPEPDEVKAYTEFISLLCKLSKELKRASSTETPVTNEKYAFRCFLLRLGFIGSEYKKERKILLQNLSGNSSWKNGAPEKNTKNSEEVQA